MSDPTRLENELSRAADVNRRLRERRLAIGMTQAELARITGIWRPNIVRIEKGMHEPSLQTLARCAAALNTSVAALLSKE